MARFHFHLSAPDPVVDAVGEELAGPHEAREAALQILSEVVRGKAHEIWTGEGLRLSVTDAGGGCLALLEVRALIGGLCRQEPALRPGANDA